MERADFERPDFDRPRFDMGNSFLVDNLGNPVIQRELLDIDLLARYADRVIDSKYPQLARAKVYPLRKTHMPMLLELHKKMIKSQAAAENNIEKSEEFRAKQEFNRDSENLGRQQMKHFTLLNGNIDHKVPLIVKNALITLKLYKYIPILNGVLMAPYNFDALDNGRTRQKIWDKGKLARLNLFKLRSLMDYSPAYSSLIRDKKLNQIPEYQILKTYITNPGKLTNVVSKIIKKQRDFQNPKKMASLLFKDIKKQHRDNPINNSNLYYSKYLDSSDRGNYQFLSGVLDSSINLKKSQKNRIAPYMDSILEDERLPTNSMRQSYSYFTPQYFDRSGIIRRPI